MKLINTQKIHIFTAFWLVLISSITILKFAPSALHADILINTVMSLQKMTLYYWGQNRLLNVLPFTVSIIKDPTLNLVGVLMLTSMSLYGFLYFISRAAATILAVDEKNEVTLKVFIVVSSLFLLLFSKEAISEMTMGHVEYALPALILVVACLRLLGIECIKSNWYKSILPVFAIFLAIGINPSTLIPAAFVAACSALYKKKIRINEILLFAAATISFIVWDYISKQYAGDSYNAFSLDILYSGLYRSLANMLGMIGLPLFMVLAALISLQKIYRIVFRRPQDYSTKPIVAYITNAAVIFSIGWIVLFSSNSWIKANQFACRYFIYVFFAFLFVLAVRLAGIFKIISARSSLLLTILSVIAVLPLVVTSTPVFAFSHYNVFRHVNSLTESGGGLYAGDYWSVWPSVLRDMMDGHEAYGLAPRGEANSASARAFVLDEVNRKGYFDVYCLHCDLDDCMAQVSAILGLGPLSLVDTTVLKDGVKRVRLSLQAQPLDSP